MARPSAIDLPFSLRRVPCNGEDKREVLEDFYWLRFLELETPAEASSNTGSMSCKKMDKMGQSIFTVTKRMRKEEKCEEYGFENNIVWTKPCVVGKLIKDSLAERCHLEAGDLIIFIDKKNCVDEDKDVILNLITNSKALTLEVFRRAHIKVNPYLSPPLATVKQQRAVTSNDYSLIESIPLDVESNKVKLVAKNSVESKRKLLVTFSKEEVKKNFSNQKLAQTYFLFSR